MQRVARRVCTAAAAQSSRRPTASLAVAAAARLQSSACVHRHRLLPFATAQQRYWSSLPSPLSSVSTDASAERAPRKATRGHWNVHHEVVTRHTSLPVVFERLKAEKQLRTLKAASVRQAIDMFYFHCVQQATTLDATFRDAVIAYFDTELFVTDCNSSDSSPFVLGETLNEAVFSAVIKLHLEQNDAAAAWRVVDKLHAASHATLHFRTVGAILEHECRSGNFVTAITRWQQLKRSRGVGWTTAMEDVLVQMVVAAMSHTDTIQFDAHMRELLHDLRLACKEISNASAQRLRHAFTAAGYAVKTLPSDDAMAPSCLACGTALTKLGIADAERAQLLRSIEARESKVAKDGGLTAKELLAPFKQWLLAKPVPAPGRLHFVLDGPNIAYINQNFDNGSCRLDHIDAVAELLIAAGHEVSITMPFSYLADRIVLRIRTKKTKQQHKHGKFTTRQRTAAEKALIEKWQLRGWLFSCRTDCISDDLFWLYASVLLGSTGRVVTNDQGRDHVFALLNSSSSSKGSANSHRKQVDDNADASPAIISMDLIDRWKELSIVNIEIQHEEVPSDASALSSSSNNKIPIEAIRLLHPLPFSRVPQVSAPEHFHFPIASDAPVAAGANTGSGGGAGVATAGPASIKHARRKWLCVHRKAAATE